MTIHEFGKDNQETVLLLHPSAVMWDYFEYVIPLMQDRYHLIIPALPGYDEEAPGDFTSVEKIAAGLAHWLKAHGISGLSCIYGCSMGGSIVMRFLADNKIKVRAALVDGGITPYQLPWIATRFLAIRDFLMIYLGKLGGIKLLEKAFHTDEYSEEDLQYVAKVLAFMSPRTIWRTFESCNNYKMPKEIHTDCRHMEYWYTPAEKKAREWDIRYVRKYFPMARFRVFDDVGHGGLAALKPELLASEIDTACRGDRGRFSVSPLSGQKEP